MHALKTLCQLPCVCHLVPKWLIGIYSIVLGAFTNLQKGNISFIVCPSVCMEQLGSHWKDFMKYDALGFFPKSVRKFKFIKNRQE
jgi:hypothetical protein